MKAKDLALRIEDDAAAAESIVLSLVGRVASWVGPLPIAIFTATETRAIFGVSNGVALAASVALELIGVNLANRYVKFTQYNATKTKTAPPVDERLAKRLMWAFYTLDFAVCGLIVGQRLALGQPATNLIALLYPIAAAASIISMNQEIQLKRAQAAQEQEKAERASAKAVRASAETPVQIAVKTTARAKRSTATVADWRAITAKMNGERATLTIEELQALLQSEGYALPSARTQYNWLADARAESAGAK